MEVSSSTWPYTVPNIVARGENRDAWEFGRTERVGGIRRGTQQDWHLIGSNQGRWAGRWGNGIPLPVSRQHASC